jgi:hypothetical protein
MKSEARVAVRAFTTRIVYLARAMPRNAEGRALGKELERLGVSLAKTYLIYSRLQRGHDHSKSVAQAGKCLKILTEVSSWLEVIAKANLGWGTHIPPIQIRCQRLIEIFTAIRTEPNSP